jgi:hypothetical protein
MQRNLIGRRAIVECNKRLVVLLSLMPSTDGQVDPRVKAWEKLCPEFFHDQFELASRRVRRHVSGWSRAAL